MYLVPCTLGVFIFLSYNDGTLRNMWDGPPSLNPDYVGYDGLDGNSPVGLKPEGGGERGLSSRVGGIGSSSGVDGGESLSPSVSGELVIVFESRKSFAGIR